MMIIIELGAMLGPKNLPTVSGRTMRNSPAVQAMGWDPENSCSPAQVLTSYRTYVFSKLPSQLPTLMRKICNGLGTKKHGEWQCSPSHLWRCWWHGGSGGTADDASNIKNVKLVFCPDHDRRSIAKQNDGDKHWLVAAKDASHVEPLHAYMHVLVPNLQSIRGDFCWQDFAIEVDQCQMCSTYLFQPKFPCLPLHLFDTWWQPRLYSVAALSARWHGTPECMRHHEKISIFTCSTMINHCIQTKVALGGAYAQPRFITGASYFASWRRHGCDHRCVPCTLCRWHSQTIKYDRKRWLKGWRPFMHENGTHSFSNFFGHFNT